MVDNFNTSVTSEEMVKSNALEKLLFITTPFNSSMENKTIGSTSFNGSFLKDELGWFDYEWVSSDVSNATEEKPMFDYDTSVRVVMLSVLLGLAISILIRIIVLLLIWLTIVSILKRISIVIIFKILFSIGLAIVGNSFAFQTLATDGARGLGRS